MFEGMGLPIGFSIIFGVISFLIPAAVIITIIIVVVKSAKNSNSNSGKISSSIKQDLNSKNAEGNYRCEYCGSTISANEKKCPNCGAKKSGKTS